MNCDLRELSRDSGFKEHLPVSPEIQLQCHTGRGFSACCWRSEKRSLDCRSLSRTPLLHLHVPPGGGPGFWHGVWLAVHALVVYQRSGPQSGGTLSSQHCAWAASCGSAGLRGRDGAADLGPLRAALPRRCCWKKASKHVSWLDLLHSLCFTTVCCLRHDHVWNHTALPDHIQDWPALCRVMLLPVSLTHAGHRGFLSQPNAAPLA